LAVAALSWPLAAYAGHEQDSLFSADKRRTIVDDAAGLGWDVRRLTSTASALEGSTSPASTILLIIAPTKPYGARDREAIHQFVNAGGSLVVADAFEQGNSVLDGLGASLHRGRLVQVGNQNVSVSVGGEPFDVPLGPASAIHFGPGVLHRVLASTNNQSFLDLDGDGTIGASDPGGPFPLVAEWRPSAGRGIVLVVADPSWLTTKDAGATRFRAALLKHLGATPGLLVIDESHQPIASPFMRAAAEVSRSLSLFPVRGILFGVGLVLLVLLFWPAPRGDWGPHRFLPERFIDRTSAMRGTNRPTASRGKSATTWTSKGIVSLCGGTGLLLLGLLGRNAEAQYAGGFLLLAACAATFTRAPTIQASAHIAQSRLDEAAGATCRLELQSLSSGAANVEVRQPLPPEFEVGRGTEWFQAWLPGHSKLQQDCELTPAVRGPYTLAPLEVRVQDPLRLRSITAVAGTPLDARVAPLREPIRTLPFGTRFPMITMGPHLVNRSGDGMEFHSLRNYLLGDSFRIVNWKASARSKDLVVNQRVHETMTSLTIVLDARAVSGAGPADATPIVRLSRAVASLAHAVLRVRDRIRVFSYGTEVVEAAAATGSRQFEALLDTLSVLRPEGDMPFIDVARSIAPRLRPKSPLLIATCADGDSTLAEGLKLLTSIGVLPFLITAPIHARKDHALRPDQIEAIERLRTENLGHARALGIPIHELRPGVSLEYQFRVGGAS
jgi:uncharacterized protein (DUF58 family)